MTTREEEVKYLDTVMGSGRLVAGEKLESVYIWDSERTRKTGIV